ncbi:MAG: hypothetical protein ACWA5L_01410 [bacterium]
MQRAFRNHFAVEQHQGRDFRFRGLQLRHQNFQPNFEIVNRKRAPAAGMVKRIKHIIKTEQPEAVVGVFMGNEYNALVLLNHPEPFDIAWPTDDLPTDMSRRIIGRELMKDQLRHMVAGTASLYFQLFKEIYDGPVFQLPPPPPVPSAEHIASYPGNFAGRVAEYGISPAPLRMKMWRLYCEVLQEVAMEQQAETLALPASIYDADGFLKEEYWNPDPTHGNEDYGIVLLETIVEKTLGLIPEKR